MKNKEKYAKEIVEITINGHPFAYDTYFKRVVPCRDIQCVNCLFNGMSSCLQGRLEWANAEYKEPRQFTVREKAFINLFPEIQYIAKDENDKIFGYLQKPIKDEEEGCWFCVDGPDIVLGINLGDLLKFESIQWEDEEPTSREEILRGSDE